MFAKRWPALSAAKSLYSTSARLVCEVRCEDTSYSQEIYTTEFSEAEDARKLFDEDSMEGVDGKSIESVQPKKRRTRINY